MEVYCKCVCSIRAKLSPACLILILAMSGPTVVSLPLFGGRSLFEMRKSVKCLLKPCLFITWSDIAFPDFVGASIKLVSYSQVIFLMLYPR